MLSKLIIHTKFSFSTKAPRVVRLDLRMGHIELRPNSRISLLFLLLPLCPYSELIIFDIYRFLIRPVVAIQENK